MHILEQYALGCGTKIASPYIYEKYISLPFEKYITFHPQGKFSSRLYDYWQEVINFIHPVLLKNNIHIVQIGAQNESLYNFCYPLNGQTDYNNVAYVIRNSLLHLGVDSFPIHIASAAQKKIVGLYCNMYKQQSGPYWSAEKDVILLEADLKGNKPTYAAEENPKTINTIKPEEIANAVFSLLGFKEELKQKSVYFGAKYSSKNIIEYVPDHIPQIRLNQNEILNIRADLNPDEKILSEISKLYPLSIIINNELNLKNLNLKNIKQIIYYIDKDLNIRFLKEIQKYAINCVLISNDESLSSDIKLKTMDFGNIFPVYSKENEKKSEEFAKENVYFKTNKILISKGLPYPSVYHYKNNIILDKEHIKFIHNKDIYTDLDFNYIYSI